MKYAKGLLTRGNSPSFGVMKNLFGGEGETQLQIEQFNLKQREALLSKKLKALLEKSNQEYKRRVNKHNTLPFIALIGYTNAGKSALTNLCTGADLESENLLF